jgi:WD40 repeat protein
MDRGRLKLGSAVRILLFIMMVIALTSCGSLFSKGRSTSASSTPSMTSSGISSQNEPDKTPTIYLPSIEPTIGNENLQNSTGSISKTVSPIELQRIGLGRIVDMSLSPDGEILAVETVRGIWLYDAGNLPTQKFIEVTPLTYDMSWSADHQRLAIIFADRSIAILYTKTGKIEKINLPYKDGIDHFSLSADGRYLAATDYHNLIHVWDLVKSKEVVSFIPKTDDTTEIIGTLKWSPDAKQIISIDEPNCGARLWDIRSGEQDFFINAPGRDICNAVWSPDGSLLATVNQSGTLQIWNVSEKREIQKYNSARAITKISWSPDSRYLLLGGVDKQVVVWEIYGAQQKFILTISQPWIWSLAWNSSKSQIVVAISDHNYGRFLVELFDIQNGQRVQSMEIMDHLDHVIDGIAWSPDGNNVGYFGSDGTFRIWDNRYNQLSSIIKITDEDIYPTAISMDWSKFAIRVGKEIEVWGIEKQERSRVFTGLNSTPQSIAFSPDGTLLAAGCDDNTIRVWDLYPGNQIEVLDARDNGTFDIAWSPDGKKFASGGWFDVYLWGSINYDNPRKINGFGLVQAIDWSPDGKKIALTEDYLIHIINVDDGETQITLPNHENASEIGITSLDWSPDGLYLATGDGNGKIQIWDPTSGVEIQSIKAHEDLIGGISWSPDGKQLVSGSLDGTVRIWRIFGD